MVLKSLLNYDSRLRETEMNMAQIPDDELEDYKRWRKERTCCIIDCDQIGHNLISIPKGGGGWYCKLHWQKLMDELIEKIRQMNLQ